MKFITLCVVVSLTNPTLQEKTFGPDMFPEYLALKKTLIAVEEGLRMMDKKVDDNLQNLKIVNEPGIVNTAFTVSLESNGQLQLGTAEVLKFDRVLLNRGSCYESNSGIFTVAISGLYQLSVTIMAEYGFNDLCLYKNEEIIVGLSDSWSQDLALTANPVLELKTGDQVLVRTCFERKMASINGNDYSFMSGYLIGR